MMHNNEPVSPENQLFSHFLSHARDNPDRVALRFANRELTFSQLLELTEQCARWLAVNAGLTQEKRTGTRIVLQLPKAPLTYGLWLACIRQGVTYTFADPRNPELRTQSILSQLEPALVVSTQQIANPHGKAVFVERLDSADDLGEINGPLPDIFPVAPGNPVYVMFTSGSTGDPKGAVIPVRGVLNLMNWARRDVVPLAHSAGRSHDALVFSNINPLHFDNSVFDLFCGLMNGNTLVPVETSKLANPVMWVRQLQQCGTQVIFGVPTLFQTFAQLHLLTPEKLPDAKLFAFGGEGFPVAALQKFLDAFKGKARLLNVYGPTETSCICSSIEIDDEALAKPDILLPSIGKMHKGFMHVIVDEDGKPVKQGVTGELWIGGDNVGLGYFNNPEISQRAFIQNPQHTFYRDIWYKTGDLVSEDEQGYLWFAGRADNQVKVRGYRIELEEIDACLERFAGIERANTVVIERDGDDVLMSAYSGPDKIEDEQLVNHCRNGLPPYMIPVHFVFMAELPKNANGKIDRKAIRRELAQQR